MPQIWLTYPELSDFLGCAPGEAKPYTVQLGWARRVSRDGQTRVKLPEDRMIPFMQGRVAGTGSRTDELVSALRQAASAMADAPAPATWTPDRRLTG